ncbi:MAG TPA: hypothetical protein VIY48_15170 [Candidatus Paceibacterota bacterium]
MTEEVIDGSGKGVELALPGDTIRKRHIATRASNRRRIVVLVLGDAEFEGYSIGLDEHSLQLLELPSGEVSSIALDHIVAITDGKTFGDLTREEKDVVDRRTASFRKTSQAWLVKNWPEVYDRRDEDGHGHYQARSRVSIRREPPGPGKPWTGPLLGEGSPDGGK